MGFERGLLRPCTIQRRTATWRTSGRSRTGVIAGIRACPDIDCRRGSHRTDTDPRARCMKARSVTLPEHAGEAEAAAGSWAAAVAAATVAEAAVEEAWVAGVGAAAECSTYGHRSPRYRRTARPHGRSTGSKSHSHRSPIGKTR